MPSNGAAPWGSGLVFKLTTAGHSSFVVWDVSKLRTAGKLRTEGYLYELSGITVFFLDPSRIFVYHFDYF